jgi:aspartate carbamoyltransferase regulatory subunit
MNDNIDFFLEEIEEKMVEYLNLHNKWMKIHIDLFRKSIRKSTKKFVKIEIYLF